MSGRNVCISLGVYIPQKPRTFGKGATEYPLPRYLNTSLKLKTKVHSLNAIEDKNFDDEVQRVSKELQTEMNILIQNPGYLESIVINLLKKIRNQENI